MSKKLIYVRIIGIGLIVALISLVAFLLVRCNVIGIILEEPKSYVREHEFSISTESATKKYLNKIEENQSNKDKNKVTDNKNLKDNYKKVTGENKTEDNTPWWSSFKSILSGVKSFVSNIVGTSNNDKVVKKKKITEYAKNIQKIYDSRHLEKSTWHVIDTDNDGYGYNYYFDDKSNLLTDSVTYDYRIVDVNGREVDIDLVPILYKVSTSSNVISNIENETTHEPSKVIYSPGAKKVSDSKAYDNTMDRNMLLYIYNSSNFRKTTNGTVYDGEKWKGVSSLKDDGGYVIFNNPKNNYNKVTGIIATEDTLDIDKSTNCTLYVYDYEHRNIDIDEPLYVTSSFNYTEPYRFTFTFYRSIKNLYFYIDTDSTDDKKRVCYLKNLRYGFSNKAYVEELEEKKEEEDYINLLKELGIYKEITDMEDENGDILEDDYLEDYEYVDFEDVDLVDKDTRTKEEKARDKVTGPAFDEELKNKKQVWEEGPAFDSSLK